MDWHKRPKVRDCEWQDSVDCPQCGRCFACTHEDNEDGPCDASDCPLWNGKKWKVDPHADLNKLMGININKPSLNVKHAKLERYSDSAYKSLCPVCKEGILFMRRHPETGQLLEGDNCGLCGQAFVYADVEKLEKY